MISRLLLQPVHILSTGGGAFMDPATRDLIAESGISIWLRANLDLLVARTARRDNRPLLKGKDPVAVLTELARVRYPAYAEAQVHVQTGDTPHGVAVDAILSALRERLGQGAAQP